MYVPFSCVMLVIIIHIDRCARLHSVRDGLRCEWFGLQLGETGQALQPIARGDVRTQQRWLQVSITIELPLEDINLGMGYVGCYIVSLIYGRGSRVPLRAL